MPIQKITTGVIDGTATIANTAISGTITTSQLSGSITSDKITSVNANTITTGTLPSARLGSDVMVSGNMPAFSVYLSSNQTMSNNTDVIVPFDTKEFDTASCYDTSTYRFTPTIAGYYQFNMAVLGAGGATSVSYISFYKNGSAFKRGSQIPNNADGVIPASSALIYLNGSTDYVEGYFAQLSGVSRALTTGAGFCYFQGYLVRTA